MRPRSWILLRQAGWSTLEVLVAALVGGILIALSGFIFLRQTTAYAHHRKLADTQAAMRKVLHVMTRDIASAGGWMGDARRDFQATPERIRFAYFDVRGRYCGSPDTVVMSFFMENGPGGASLIQEYRCERGTLKRRVLAAGANDNLSLSFRYLDSAGAVVSQPARVKAVRVSIAKRSEQAGRMPATLRAQTIQVEMVNL